MHGVLKTEKSIWIFVNGSKREAPFGAALQDLVQTFGLERKSVVVELNRQVINRSLYSETVLHEGDIVELVQFVGGG